MSMNDSKYDDDDDYNECVLEKGNDRRRSIRDSPNKLDTIIECVVSIKSEYTPDKKLQQHEFSHGTGTIIHANEQNIYILTAAHNIIAVQKECKCGTKTLKENCVNKNCMSSNPTTYKTQNKIKAEKILFSLRDQSGVCIETHQIDDFKFPDEYYEFPTASGGYDIAILIFKCKKKEMVDSYREKCSKFSFINDEYFGGGKSLMHIYGYPYEKMEKRNDGTYYYLWGMGTSKLDGTNKFRVAKNKNTKKLYIENKGIDTTPGQSGSCIYSYNGEDKTRYLIYGVHTGGKSEIQTNYGTFCDIYNIEWITNILDVKNEMTKLPKFITCHSAFTKGSQELEKKIILLQKQSLQKSQELEKKIILLQKESLQKSQKLEKNALLLKKELEQRKCSPITAIIKLILFIGVIVALIMCGINYNYNWFGRTFTQNETCDEKVYYETIDDALNDNCEMNMTQINDTWCMKYNSMINDCEKLNETKKKFVDDITSFKETIKNINQTWRNKYESLGEKHNKTSKDNQLLSGSITVLNEKITLLTANISEERMLWQNQYDMIFNEMNSSCQRQLHDYEVRYKSLQKMHANITALNDNTTSLRNQCSDEMKLLQDKMNQIENKCKANMTQINSRYESLQKIHTETNKHNQRLNASVTDLKHDIKLLKQRSSEERISWQDKYESLKKKQFCVGQLYVEFNYPQKNYTLSIAGTATVFTSKRNSNSSTTVFVLSAAHIVRRNVWQCCGQYVENANDCSKCDEKKDYVMINATNIQFKRKVTDASGVGYIEDRYACKVEYLDEYNYKAFPYPKSGFDWALLSFVDEKNYYWNNCVNIELATIDTKQTPKYKQFMVLGYPGDKSKQMWGYKMDRDSVTMKYETSTKTKNIYLKHREVDTTQGQSGAAIASQVKDKMVIWGIHVGGNDKDKYNKYNIGTLLNKDIIKHINCIINGTQKWVNRESDKTSYFGFVKNGKPHGYGKTVWKSGSYYEGSMKNGNKHGYGKYV
eukprot:268191_1